MSTEGFVNRNARRYDILVAVGGYKDTLFHPIKCCENDIQLLSNSLANIPYLSGQPPHQTVITSRHGQKETTKTNILRKVEHSLKNISSDDMLILVFSCHGISYEGETYLVPSDANRGRVDSLISFMSIKELLDGVDCKFKVILVDACHSGDANITFKGQPARIAFDETTPVVTQLVRESRGLAYATSCTHDQVALIQPDGMFSIWMHSLATALTEINTSDDVIAIEPVIATAARVTLREAQGHYSMKQTPYYVIKAAGSLPIGLLTKGSSAPPTGSLDSSRVSVATTVAFEARFVESFGRFMAAHFDQQRHQCLTTRGFPLNRVVSIGPQGSRVRLAVVFDLIMRSSVVTIAELLDIQNLAEVRGIDRIIIPRIHPWEQDIRCRSAQLKKLYMLQIPREGVDNVILRDFCNLKDFDANITLAANKYSDVVLKQMGKLFHIVLSDMAAPTYDNQYGHAYFGTHETMRYEDNLMLKTVQELDPQELAVDIGCGTGRHSIMLAEHFTRVIGYDFSPGMIEVANRKKREKEENENGSCHNVEFHLQDIEQIPVDCSLNSIDLLVASFGMMSFIDDIVSFLNSIKEQMRSGGKAILSFYNKEALMYVAPPPWRDSSLSALLDSDRNELEVTLSNGGRFRVFCKPYTYVELEKHVSPIFERVQIFAYPAFSSFLPNIFFSQGSSASKAKKIIEDVDKELAEQPQTAIGNYLTAICNKA